MNAALERGEWSVACPGHTLPPGKTQYPFYRRLGRPQGQSGWAENLIPTRIRSLTVQPIAQSLYQLSYLAHCTLTKYKTTGKFPYDGVLILYNTSIAIVYIAYSKLDHNISFKLQPENNKKSSYLDVIITVHTGSLQYSIFIKPIT